MTIESVGHRVVSSRFRMVGNAQELIVLTYCDRPVNGQIDSFVHTSKSQPHLAHQVTCPDCRFYWLAPRGRVHRFLEGKAMPCEGVTV